MPDLCHLLLNYSLKKQENFCTLEILPAFNIAKHLNNY